MSEPICPKCYEPVSREQHFCANCGTGIAPIPCQCTVGLREGHWTDPTPPNVESRKLAEWVEIRIVCPACHLATPFKPRTWMAVDKWNHWAMGRGREGDVVQENAQVKVSYVESGHLIAEGTP